MKVDNSIPLPVLKPEISGYTAIMLIDLSIAILPAVIFAGRYPEPEYEQLER